MCKFVVRALGILILAACPFTLVACTKPEPKVVHDVVPAGGGQRLGCRLCYDETVRVLTGAPKYRRYKTIQRHRCEECKTDVAFYDGDDGKLMIRCARCAPDGVQCDRCLPPMTSTSQSAHASSAGP